MPLTFFQNSEPHPKVSVTALHLQIETCQEISETETKLDIEKLDWSLKYNYKVIF